MITVATNDYDESRSYVRAIRKQMRQGGNEYVNGETAAEPPGNEERYRIFFFCSLFSPLEEMRLELGFGLYDALQSVMSGCEQVINVMI